MVYSLHFFSSKCSLFHNSNVFGSCIIHILYTGCAKIKKNNSGAKRLTYIYITDTVLTNIIIIFSYGVMTQLITFVPSYTCNNTITMKVAAVVSETCLIKYIINIEVYFVDCLCIMRKYV